MTECWKTGRLVRKLEDAKKLIYVVIPVDFFFPSTYESLAFRLYPVFSACWNCPSCHSK
jgi:hypothetical protein